MIIAAMGSRVAFALPQVSFVSTVCQLHQTEPPFCMSSILECQEAARRTAKEEHQWLCWTQPWHQGLKRVGGFRAKKETPLSRGLTRASQDKRVAVVSSPI